MVLHFFMPKFEDMPALGCGDCPMKKLCLGGWADFRNVVCASCGKEFLTDIPDKTMCFDCERKR